MSFAIDLVAETVAMVEISEDDATVKLNGMPSMVTNYQVRLHINRSQFS